MIDVYSPFSLLLRVTAGDTDRADVSIAGDYEGLHLTFVGVHHLVDQKEKLENSKFIRALFKICLYNFCKLFDFNFCTC